MIYCFSWFPCLLISIISGIIRVCLGQITHQPNIFEGYVYFGKFSFVPHLVDN